MNPELVIQTVVRWAHILSAVALVGGIIFLRCVLWPASKSLSDEDARELEGQVMRRWRRLVMVSVFLLLASGLYNFVTTSLVKAEGSALYHPIFGIKFLAAMVVFFLSSVLCGRSEAFEKMRANPGKWLTLNILLAILVVLLGAILRTF